METKQNGEFMEPQQIPLDTWAQTITTIVTIVGTLGGFIIWQTNRLDDDIKQQGRRTDRLYEMFIELLKERK